MSEAAISPAPMEGEGAYNRSSYVQAAGLSPAVPFLEQAAALVDLPRFPDAVVVADYGSSQGRNSLEPMGVAIRALRRRTPHEQATSVVHTDLPDSDYAALFQTLETDERSYLRIGPAIFASAVGRSFYEQILPTGSVTLGWSSWAVQWLSHAPAPIPDQVQVAYSQDKSVLAAYNRQAAEDWRAFLAHRDRELRPGGRLVVLTMALTDDGDFGYRPLLDAMYAALVRLVEEGFIKVAELHRMAIPTVGRSLADIKAPFFDGGRFGGLVIEHAEVFLGEDPFWEDYRRDGIATAFAARWSAFSRASVLPTLAQALDGGSDDPRHAAFLDQVEAGVTARLAAEPEKMIVPLAAAVFAKLP